MKYILKNYLRVSWRNTFKVREVDQDLFKIIMHYTKN